MLRSGSIGREALRLEAPDFALTGMLADPLLPVREHRHDHPHFIIGTSGAYEHSVGSACAVAVAPFVIYYPSGTSHADRFLRGRGSFVALTLASGDPAGRPVLGTDASSQEAAAAVALGLTGHGSSNDSIAARVERLTTVFARAGADRTSMPKWLSSAYSSLAAADAGFNVSRVADLVGVHRVHLARAFRSRFGCSPVAFLRARRLERAAGLLMDAERPIVDVAQDCGFVDQAHLTREFSDMFGVPPGAWRTAELQKFKTLGCQHHQAGRMVVVRFVLLVSIAASLAAAGTTVAGASPAVSAIDRLVRDGHVPGAAIAVVRDGRLVDERLIGYSDVRNRTTVTRRVRFQLASITKVFTTLALMRLDQQDRLRIEDPVGKYLPRLPPAWREVRIRELAQHISGLPDVIADPNKPLSQTELLQTEDEALSKAIGRSVASFPGETFRYDQTNYVLLKRVIERVTGRSFIDAVHSLLGSRGSGLVWGDGRTRLPSRTRMYEWRGGALLGASGVFAYPAYLDAAAGANASLATMERLAAALTGGRMLNEAHLARLWKPAHRRDGSVIDVGKDFGVAASLSPAMGWFVADNSDGRYPRVFMTGGSATAIMVFPKQRLAVVVLTDLHADDDPLPIAEAAAAPYLPGMRPIFQESSPWTETGAEPLAGVHLDLKPRGRTSVSNRLRWSGEPVVVRRRISVQVFATNDWFCAAPASKRRNYAWRAAVCRRVDYRRRLWVRPIADCVARRPDVYTE